MMPEMDGFEFLEELRRREEYAAVPVVVATAKELTTEERTELNLHVENIVQKGTKNAQETLRAVKGLFNQSLRRRVAA